MLVGVRDDRFPSAFRYLAVGVLSYGFDIAVMALCWHILRLPLWLATSAGFWSSFSVNFLLSRHWTFDATQQAAPGQLVRYSALVAVNYLITVLAVTGLHRTGMDAVLARTITLTVLTISTYFLYRRWVFQNSAGQ